MKRMFILVAISALLMVVTTPVAEAANPMTSFFVSCGAWSHMYNWLQDDDGDGIPNGLDEDWIAPKDGTGYQHQHERDADEPGLTYADPEQPRYRNSYEMEYKWRKFQDPEDPRIGDLQRDRDRLRDGSCNDK